MRVAIVGQKDFGKAVLEAFAARGDDIVGVFCAPAKAGEAPDPLAVQAAAAGIEVQQFVSLRSAEAKAALSAMRPDIAVLAYVLQFVPQDFARIPKHGTIQFHPSLLPRYRGPSSINWPVILGDEETGLTIFRPTDGLDEGPVILQKTTPIGPDDTCGGIYFERLFPMGIAALWRPRIWWRVAPRGQPRRMKSRRAIRAGAASRRRASTGTPTSTRYTT